MKSFKRWINCFVTLVLLLNGSACSPAIQHSTATVQPTTSPTIQIASSPTIVPPASTPKPINTLHRICDEEWAITRDTSNIPGSLIYSAEYGVFVSDISSSRTYHIFKSIKYPDISVFSKQDTIATIDVSFVSKSRLWIASKDKEFSITFPEMIHNANLSSLDNQKILLRSEDELDQNYTDNGTTDKFYILSLGTEKFAPYSVFLPSLSLREHQFSGPNDNFNPPWVKYSPDLKYVAYPTQQGWDKNSILNIETGDTLPFDWSLDFWVTPHPFWRPDSGALTVLRTDSDNPHYNFYSIDLNGKAKQLTRLENIVNDMYQTAPSASWSPDSRYLAFPIYLPNQGGDGTIFVLDTDNGNILDLCYSEQWPQVNGNYVWSQDGKYLATYVNSKIQIVDLENETIYDVEFNASVPLNAFPLRGWVNWEIP